MEAIFNRTLCVRMIGAGKFYLPLDSLVVFDSGMSGRSCRRRFLLKRPSWLFMRLGFVEEMGVFDALIAAGVIGVVGWWRWEGVSRALGSSTNHDVEGNDEDNKD